MITAHEYPIRMVEHKWFYISTKWMNGKSEWISSMSIKRMHEGLDGSLVLLL
jgi:hypothetical protein